MFTTNVANAIYLFITHQLFPSLQAKTHALCIDNRLFLLLLTFVDVSNSCCCRGTAAVHQNG